MDPLKLLASIFALFIVAHQIVAIPGEAESPKSLVAHSNEDKPAEYHAPTADTATTPIINQMHVKSEVRNRFAHTTVTSKVMNIARKPLEAVFSVVLPETAFISGFIMEVGGKNYTAYVKEKLEAKKVYDAAVAKGAGAAHVAVSARDSNRFTVSVNVESETKAAFYLTYEELLVRRDGLYELVVNLHPGQPVKDLSAEVIIMENRKITNLKAPPIRSGNEIGNEQNELDPRVEWGIANETSAVVMFSPNLNRQLEFARLLGTKENKGFSGQFVVQYDVERDPKGGEVLLGDGYFVHFFAPSNLTPLSKHVVFVLDTSSSMQGQKMVQLREAMDKILEQLHSNDLFSLVEFNTYVRVWDINNPGSSVYYPSIDREQSVSDGNLEEVSFPPAYLANADNIRKAKGIVAELKETAATNVYTALKVGLYLTKLTSHMHKSDSIYRQPLIMFLTDGEPTQGETSTQKIVNDVINVFNSGPGKAAIFSLSFGDGADRKFLQKLSLRNSGFSKHIYEAADAALQLQNFYKQISSPLLSNVTFKYAEETANITNTRFPMYFSGSELVVSGWYGKDQTRLKRPAVAVEAWNGHELISLKPAVRFSVTNHMERLWAYLSIKQLLQTIEVGSADRDMSYLKTKALGLAVRYSFVTSLSSLVVVKPDAAKVIDTEVAKQVAFDGNSNFGSDAEKLESFWFNVVPVLVATVMGKIMI